MTGISTAVSSLPIVAPAIVFPKGFSPDFFKLPQARIDDAVLTGAISFPQHEDETVAEFEQSPQFALFAHQFLTHLDGIKQFASEYLGETAHDIGDIFDGFASRLFDRDYAFFGEEKNILYGIGMRSLCQFAGLLTDSGINLAHRKNSVLQLADGVQECAAGAAVNLADAAGTLQSIQGGEFLRIRDTVAVALIAEYQQQLDIAVSYEIHLGTRLRNEMAEMLGFEKIEDHVADLCVLDPKIVANCRQHLLQKLTPARLAIALAEEYLQAFRQPIIETLKEGKAVINLSEPLDYQQFSEHLSAAKAPLKNYGEVAMRSLLTYADEDYSRIRLNADPSLIALDILNEQRRNGTVAENYQAATLVKWRHRETEICVMHHAGQIAWATENSESRLLGTKHLMLMHPQEFKGKEDVARRIVANVILNETPEMVQASLSLPWLSIADPQQVFATWKQAAISRYLKRHTMQISILPRFRKLAIIKGIVAYGTLSDLSLFVQNGLTLFAEPKDKTRILPEFFAIALLRGDHRMLAALGTLLLNAAGKRIPLSTGNAMFTAVNARGVSALHTVLKSKEANSALVPFGEIALRAALRRLMTSLELEEILSAKNAYGTAAFLFAMQNNDKNKILDFGAIIMGALKLKALDARQVETLLRADNGRGAPALYFGVINDCDQAIVTYSSIVLSGHSERLLTQKQASALLTGRTDETGTVLLCAMNHDSEKAVIAYGKVLVTAIKYKALTPDDICDVLGGGSTSKTYVLEAPLHRNQAGIIIAFGDILLGFYERGVLNREQVCTILCGADPVRAQVLMKSLASNHEAAMDALAQIVFKADIIRRATEGPASLPLSTPHHHQDALPPAVAVAASVAELRAVASAIKAFRVVLQSDAKLPDDVKAQVCALHKRMQKNYLALFFCPEAARSPKAKLLSNIVVEWTALTPILQTALIEPE